MNEQSWNWVSVSCCCYLVSVAALAGCGRDDAAAGLAPAMPQACPAITGGPTPASSASTSGPAAAAPECAPCEMRADAPQGRSSGGQSAMGNAGQSDGAMAGATGSSVAGTGAGGAGSADPAIEPPPAPDALDADQLMEECGVAPAGLAPRLVEIDSSKTPDVRLSMAVQGDATHPPLVLLHGFPDFWCGWARVIPELAKRYFVVAPDLRGFNRSSKPGDPNDPQDVAPYLMPELAQDVADIVHFAATETQQKVAVVAHDWGAIVAWPYAYLFPADLSRLMAISVSHPEAMAQFMASGDPALGQAQTAQLQALNYITELVQNDSPQRYSADDYQLLFDSLDQKHLQDPSTFPEVERAAYRRMWNADDQASFKSQIKYYRGNFGGAGGGQPQMSGLLTPVPTTFLAPIHDGAILYPHSMDFLREHIAETQPVTIQPIDTGHFPQRETPELLVKMIVQFMTTPWDAP